MKSHLDNLSFTLSLQDFFKVWSIFEVIAMLLQLFTRNLNVVRSIDLRKLKLVIDDQSKASLISLREFVHYFLRCRSGQGMFLCPPGTYDRHIPFLWKHEDKKFLSIPQLLDKILVEDGAKMDDRYPELKIADFLSGISRKTLNGEFSFNVAEKLKRIIKITSTLQASLEEEKRVDIPKAARDNVNLLLPESILKPSFHGYIA